MSSLRRIGVFCGSASGVDPAHRALAVDFGEALVAADLGLVYGGGDVGLMGAIADAVMAAGGSVVGVIPTFLRAREVAHEGVTELIEVADMHERKKEMYRRADAFVALPGGYGTFEEVFEATTWSQLGLHETTAVKPVVLLDPAGFWTPLSAFLDQAVEAGYVKAANRRLVQEARSIPEALARCAGADPGDARHTANA